MYSIQPFFQYRVCFLYPLIGVSQGLPPETFEEALGVVQVTPLTFVRHCRSQWDDLAWCLPSRTFAFACSNPGLRLGS